MNMTKRDIADIVLVWMAMSFVLALVTGIVTLGAYIGMPDEASKYTDKWTAVGFEVLYIWVLAFLCYILLFKRSPILSLIVPDGTAKELSIPASLAVLTSYAFWVRLFGLFTFLSAGIRCFSRLSMDVARNPEFAGPRSWMISSGVEGVSAILGIVVMWKADWIAGRVAGIGSSNKAPQPARASDCSGQGG